MPASPIPLHAIGIALYFDLALRNQAVEVGAAFTGRQRQHDAVIHANRPTKQTLENIDTAAGFAQFGMQPLQQALLTVYQIIDSRVQAAETIVVGGQHQHAVADPVANPAH